MNLYVSFFPDPGCNCYIKPSNIPKKFPQNFEIPYKNYRIISIQLISIIYTLTNETLIVRHVLFIIFIISDRSVLKMSECYYLFLPIRPMRIHNACSMAFIRLQNNSNNIFYCKINLRITQKPDIKPQCSQLILLFKTPAQRIDSHFNTICHHNIIAFEVFQPRKLMVQFSIRKVSLID